MEDLEIRLAIARDCIKERDAQIRALTEGTSSDSLLAQMIRGKNDWKSACNHFEKLAGEQDDTIRKLTYALRDCVEHLEHSTPQGQAAWAAATKVLLKLREDADLALLKQVEG